MLKIYELLASDILGKLVDGTHITHLEIQVRYAETDRRGFVHEMIYMNWLQESRFYYCQSRGIDMAEMGNNAFTLHLTEFTARSFRPARVGQTIWVDTWLVNLEKAELAFGYEIKSYDGLLLTVQTKHVFVDGAGKEIDVPSELANKLRVSYAST